MDELEDKEQPVTGMAPNLLLHSHPTLPRLWLKDPGTAKVISKKTWQGEWPGIKAVLRTSESEGLTCDQGLEEMFSCIDI